MYSSCQLQNTIGRGRVDLRQQYLQIYPLPAGKAGGVLAQAASAAAAPLRRSTSR